MSNPQVDKMGLAVLDRSNMVTTTTRSLFIHKGPEGRNEGTIEVVEITAWTKGPRSLDDILCRNYYAEYVDIDPQIRCLRRTVCDNEETLRWAHILFPEGGIIPLPVSFAVVGRTCPVMKLAQ